MSIGLKVTTQPQLASSTVQGTGATTATSTSSSTGGSGVTVGAQPQPFAAQTPRQYPRMQVALGKDFRAAGALKSESFASVAPPATSARGKVGFVLFMQKILPNSLGQRLDRSLTGGHVAAQRALHNTAQQQMATYQNATTVDAKHTALTTFRDTLRQLDGAMYKGVGELNSVVDAQIELLDLQKQATALQGDNSPAAAQKHADIATKLLANAAQHPQVYHDAGKMNEGVERLLQSQVAAAVGKERAHQPKGTTGPVHKQFATLVQQAAHSEGTAVTNPTGLFRGNTDRVAFIRAFNSTAIPTRFDHQISYVIEQFQRAGQVLELNPERIATKDIPQGKTAKDVAAANAEAMTKVFDHFMAQVGADANPMAQQATVDGFPQELCDSMRAMYEGLRATHGDAEALKQVGTNLFLRMINPMVLTPQGGELKQPHTIPGEEKPNATLLRNLVQLSKLIQNAANGQTFSEDHMRPFDSMVLEQTAHVRSLAAAVVARGRAPNEL